MCPVSPGLRTAQRRDCEWQGGQQGFLKLQQAGGAPHLCHGTQCAWLCEVCIPAHGHPMAAAGGGPGRLRDNVQTGYGLLGQLRPLFLCCSRVLRPYFLRPCWGLCGKSCLATENLGAELGRCGAQCCRDHDAFPIIACVCARCAGFEPTGLSAATAQMTSPSSAPRRVSCAQCPLGTYKDNHGEGLGGGHGASPQCDAKLCGAWFTAPSVSDLGVCVFTS